jgi:hypothetical protein
VEKSELGSLIARLRRLQEAGGAPVVLEDARDWYEVILFAPATEREIDTARMLVGKPLPPDFIEFWGHTNGANLFLNDSGLHGVGVTSTHLIGDLQREEAELYGSAALHRYILFARVNGSGDFLAFDIETGQVLDGVHAEQPHEWRPIAASFTHWLHQLLEAGGRYYWLEALYDKAAEA